MSSKNFVWNTELNCIEPTQEYVKRTHIYKFMQQEGIKTLDELVEKSSSDRKWFWGTIPKYANVEWFKPFYKVYDDSEGVEWTKWWIGGELNIAHNWLDRHVPGLSHKVATIWGKREW